MKKSYITLIISFFCLLVALYFYAQKLENTKIIRINIASDKKPENQISKTRVSLKDFDFNKNGSLSRQEARSMIEHLYKQAGDGTLNPWSKDAYIKRLDEKIVKAKIDEKNAKPMREQSLITFKSQDMNGDGLIEFEEFYEVSIAKLKTQLDVDPKNQEFLVQKKFRIKLKNEKH